MIKVHFEILTKNWSKRLTYHFKYYEVFYLSKIFSNDPFRIKKMIMKIKKLKFKN